MASMAIYEDTAPPEIDPEAFDEEDGLALRPSFDEGFDDDDNTKNTPGLKRQSKWRGAAVEDPAYSGVRSSRKAFDMEKDDSDDSEDSEDEFDEDDDGLNDIMDEDEDMSGTAEDYTFKDDDGDDDDDDDDDNDSTDGDHKPTVNDTVAQELAELEQAEAAVVEQMKQNPDVDRLKGKQTKCQLSIWDAALESRIRLQPVVQLANRLPNGVVEGDDTEEQRRKVHAACLETIFQLMKAKRVLAKKNSSTSNYLTKLSKKRRLSMVTSEDWWGELQSSKEKMDTYTSESIDKWHTKTSLASKRSKSYKSLDQSLTKQIELATIDKVRLRKRTQVLRNPIDFVDNEDESKVVENDNGLTSHENVFDDGDYYQSLLRDLIERKSESLSSDDPLLMGRHWVELNKHRSKLKKNVDTKASKGRKLRYHVHEKLVNFMAPDETVHVATDQARDDLFSSLFQAA